jgi:hypothetical protein
MAEAVQSVERFGFVVHGGRRRSRDAAESRSRTLVTEGYVVVLSSAFDSSVGDLWLLRAIRRDAFLGCAPNVGRLHPIEFHDLVRRDP